MTKLYSIIFASLISFSLLLSAEEPNQKDLTRSEESVSTDDLTRSGKQPVEVKTAETKNVEIKAVPAASFAIVNGDLINATAMAFLLSSSVKELKGFKCLKKYEEAIGALSIAFLLYAFGQPHELAAIYKKISASGLLSEHGIDLIAASSLAIASAAFATKAILKIHKVRASKA